MRFLSCLTACSLQEDAAAAVSEQAGLFAHGLGLGLVAYCLHPYQKNTQNIHYMYSNNNFQSSIPLHLTLGSTEKLG